MGIGKPTWFVFPHGSSKLPELGLPQGSVIKDAWTVDYGSRICLDRHEDRQALTRLSFLTAANAGKKGKKDK